MVQRLLNEDAVVFLFDIWNWNAQDLCMELMDGIKFQYSMIQCLQEISLNLKIIHLTSTKDAVVSSYGDTLFDIWKCTRCLYLKYHSLKYHSNMLNHGLILANNT